MLLGVNLQQSMGGIAARGVTSGVGTRTTDVGIINMHTWCTRVRVYGSQTAHGGIERILLARIH